MQKKLIGIIGGKGKMGQYFTDFFEKNGYSVIISDKRTKLTNQQLAKKADVVIISVPIGVTGKIIKEVAPHVKKSGLLMDFTSLKEFPMEAMKCAKSSYLGCHPMFGPTNSIEGQLVVLCKGKGVKWYNWWKELLLANKVEVRELSAKKHDQLMAYVQGLSHFSFLAMADALRKSGFKISDFTANQSPVYRLRLDMIGRILDQDPKLYGEIQSLNPYGADVLKLFVESVQHGVSLNEKNYEKWFKKSSQFFGAFKKKAMKESNWIIEQLNRKSVLSDMIHSDYPSARDEVAALGPENTFSSLAAKSKFPKSNIWYSSTISEVFEQVKKGKVKWGIVPVQNVLTGSVVETMQNLFESGLHVVDSFDQPVHHCLASLDDNKIKTIYSHAQPLRQCRHYLKKHYPKAQLIALPSTTAALKKVVKDDEYEAGVICSKEAANGANLKILKINIQDYQKNVTRFVVIAKKPSVKKSKQPVSMLAFHFSADAPGALCQVLSEFSDCGVNMTKIESQANPEIPGGHVFYVDFEGYSTELHIKKMLSSIKKQVAVLKMLGSY